MKKYLILILAAVVALTSCGQVNLEPTDGAGDAITFDLTANHPDGTKAVKGGWESGDAIFVFFSGAAAPKYLKMSFNGTSWTSAEYYGATRTPEALGLKNGDTGTMRAVYLPFGSGATVSASGTDFVFSKTYHAYYLTATLDYTVSDNKVSGAFNMVIPDDYVQFFVEDDAAVDETYSLGCDAVVPVGVASVSAGGAITETSDMTATDDMPGYAFGGGYLFSGKLASWSYGGYYFAKKKNDNTRADYFVTGKTLASHDAIKLPASGSDKWVAVGSGKSVLLKKSDNSSLGNWNTCNHGASLPEEAGTSVNFSTAQTLKAPNKDQLQALVDNCSWTWLTIHGQQGFVGKASVGFLFLPRGSTGYYFSSTEEGSYNFAWGLQLISNSAPKCISQIYQGNPYPVRLIQR